MSTQPTWITAAGSLGTIPEGIFYQVPILAETYGEEIYYRMISGQLPDGIQCRKTGIIEGVPKAIASLQGVPSEVSRDVTYRFAVRAYTEKLVNGKEVVDRLTDRTFELTVTGQDAPDFITPPGNIGTFYDGTEVHIQIEYIDTDPGDTVKVRYLSGTLPPGLIVTSSGLITGIIKPLTGVPGTAEPGYDMTQYEQYPFDFSTRSTSKNYQFSLELSDGKDSNIRTFEIFVYSKDSMSADTTDFTADNTFITADVVPTRTPVMITPPGDLGRIRADNFFAFKFDAIDFDGDPIEYSLTVGAGIGFDASGTVYDEDGVGFDRGTFSLPPGLALNPTTGWFYGYIPAIGATENTYKFAIRVLKVNDPEIISEFYYYTMTIIGNVETDVVWLTDPELGTIDNGSISLFSVEAYNTGGRPLEYQIVSGSDSKLPQGLRLLPSGNIVGKVSFNTFALDNGTTTFDTAPSTRVVSDPTTFDLKFDFTVNAYSPQTAISGYKVSAIQIVNGGSGYVTAPTVTISAPPSTSNSERATAGTVTIVGGVITSIALGNGGFGYVTPPTVTITGGGGVGAIATVQVEDTSNTNLVSVFRRFSITVNRAYNEPYERLYIKAMPPLNDREIIGQLVQNQDIIPAELIYRSDDANFGISQNVVYDHAYGLTASSLEKYISSLDINHYWKNLTLGNIKTAQALDNNGKVIYEIVYSEIIDNLVNNEGQSVGKSVTLAYPVNTEDSTEVSVVYPNSLVDMRDQVIDVVGQISPILPLWMTSKQTNGQILGFTPAWVIAYVKPGSSGRIAYNIKEQFGQELNIIDFEVDRYELDRSLTYNWFPYEDSVFGGKWIPYPPAATTFDAVERPLGLRYIGRVGYATTLAYSQINNQTLDYIRTLGGIDGASGRYLNGETLIFKKQENFGGMTIDEAFSDYLGGYDPTQPAIVPYDDGTYDESVIIPPLERLSVYRISITAENMVFLTEVLPVMADDYVKIVNGNTYRGQELYVPYAAPPGLTYRAWTYIPERPTTPTIFDGNSTRFISPVNILTNTDVYDKYLVFPKRTILG